MSEILAFQNTESINSEPLRTGQIHLWWVSLTIENAQLKAFEKRLSDHQKEKARRFPDEQKRRFYIAGRGYLTQLLAHYLPDNASSELCFGKQGKPSLKSDSCRVHFNFTDTCGFGLFAFSSSSELGVDVENINRSGNYSAIIKRRFSPEEQYIANESNDAFLRCWTRKEAYGKAMGTGLNYPLREHTLCEDLSQNSFQSPDGKWLGQQFVIAQENRLENTEICDDDKFIACVFSEGVEPKTLKAFRLER